MAIPFKLCHQNCWTNFRGSWLMVCTNEAWVRNYTGDGVIWCVDVIEDQPSCGDSKCELLLALRSVVRPLGPWFNMRELWKHVNWRCSSNELFAFQWWSAYFCVSWPAVGCYDFFAAHASCPVEGLHREELHEQHELCKNGPNYALLQDAVVLLSSA